MVNFNRAIAGIAAIAAAATGLTACGSSNSDALRIGTTDAGQREWDVFEELAEKEGLDVEIVNYSDYNTPNNALVQDQIDTNKFQHLQFLSEFNKGSNADLVPFAATEIYPLALFWKDHDSLDGIEGEQIAIPNDPTNQGRAINVLVQAGLITLKEEGLRNPTPADIDTAASKVEVTPVDATQTTVGYNEGRPAIINNNFLGAAGIEASEAVAQDDPNSELAEPYINVWVTTAENADDPRLQRLAELWKDPAVTEAVIESSGGSAVPVERTREELEAIMDRLESED